MPRVLFRLGPQSLEQELPIGTELAIGRDDSASSIQLTHSTADSKQQLLAPVRTLSQQHAVLRVLDSDRVQIEDCGSKNGTFLRLKPGTSLEIGEDNELLFGRELTIRLTGQPFGRERIQSAADVERPDELVKYLRAQLGSSADRIYLTTREAAERAGASRQLLRLPLSDDKQIIVKWQGSTLDVEAENCVAPRCGVAG
ncbi:MAG TPA: FHA domain-containing protein [Pseudomonadota bacterium]|nr:FHA domain-containing protein [Pseudomonadota bacterium]